MLDKSIILVVNYGEMKSKQKKVADLHRKLRSKKEACITLKVAARDPLKKKITV